MDFHGLKRKELQSLCKKHKIPANLSNREMADRLTSIFKKENEDPLSSEELSTKQEELCSENEAKVVKKQLKKVRFSPESDNQTIEYEVSVYQQPKRSRRQTLSQIPAPELENAPKREVIKNLEGCHRRVTRSRAPNAVQEDINMVSLPPAGRKRGRGGKVSKDAKEVATIDESERLELNKKDVKNGHDRVTGGLRGKQLRSRKNVTQEDLLVKDSEAKNGPRQQPTRNARKRDQFVPSRSEVADVVNNEVQIVGVKGGGCEEEKRQRRSKRISEKDSSISATSVKSETLVTKVQEQSERDIAHVEPPECSRRYSSRQKSVVCQIGKGEYKKDDSEVEKAKYTVTSQHQAPLRKSKRKVEEFDAYVEYGSKVERAKFAVTSQHLAPLRRSRRKTVVLTAPADELRASLPGKGTAEELLRESNLSGICTEDRVDVAENELGDMQQMQESILAEEKTAAREHLPVTQKPKKRSSRITPLRASVAPPNLTVKDDKKLQESKCTVAFVEEEAAPTESLPSPSELPAGKDFLVAAAEHTENENNIDVEVSKQFAKNGTKDVEKQQQSKSSMAIVEEEAATTESPPSPGELPAGKDFLVAAAEHTENENNLDVEVSKQFAKNGTKDVEKKQQSKSSMAIVEEEAATTESPPSPGELPAGTGVLVPVSEHAENEINCDVDLSKLVVKNGDSFSNKSRKGLRRNSGAKKGCGSAEASLLLRKMEECKDVRNMKETLTASSMKLVDPSTDLEVKQSAQESAAAYEKKSNYVEDAIEKLVTGGNIVSEVNCEFDDVNFSDFKRLKFESNSSFVVDSSQITFPSGSHGNGNTNQEKEDITLMNKHSSHECLAVGAEDRTLLESDKERLVQDDAANSERNDPDWVKFREVEVESNVINMDSSDITPIAALPSGDKRDLTGAVSTLLHSEEEMGAELPEVENTIFETDKVTADDSRTPGEAQIVDESNDTNVQDSPYSNAVAPGTPFQPAPENQFEEKCKAEAARTSGRGLSDQEESENPNSGNVPCIHEPALMCEENTGLLKNVEDIRIHNDYFDSETPRSLNRTVADDDSDLVEPRTVDFGSCCSKVVSPEIVSLANLFSSAGQGEHAGKSSSRMEREKVLETQEISEKLDSINYNIDAEGIRTPVVEDQMKGKLEHANVNTAYTVEEVIFNDLMNELGDSIDLEREPKISLKTSEKLGTKFSYGEGIILTESPVKDEKKEYRTEIDVTVITGTPNTIEMNGSDTVTQGTPVGLAAQNQDKLCNTRITVSIVGGEICKQDVAISLEEDETEELLEDDTIKGGIKNQPSLPLSKTGSLDDAWVEDANNTNKVVSSGMTYTADAYSSANQTIFAGETSNVLKQEKLFDLEESSMTEIVKNGSDKIEVKEDTTLAYSNATQTLPSEELTAPITSESFPTSPLDQAAVDGERNPSGIYHDEIMAGGETKVVQEENLVEETTPALKLELTDYSGGKVGEELHDTNMSNTETLPSEELTAPITSESFPTNPLDQAAVDGERNPSDERVIDHPFFKVFAASMDRDEIMAGGETKVVQEENLVGETAPALKLELTDYSGGKVGAELHDTNISNTETISQETDSFGAPSTEYPKEMSNAPAAMGTENYGNHDDQVDEVGPENDCSSSFGVDGSTSTVGIIVDNIANVGTLGSSLDVNDPQSGKKVDDPEIENSYVVKQLNTAFTIEKAGVEDGEKELDSHQVLHGGEQEDVSSFADTPCSKLEFTSNGCSTLLWSSIPAKRKTEKEHPEAMDDTNDVGETVMSTECKVTREEGDWCQINTREKAVEAKSDDCEGSMKTVTVLESIDRKDVYLSPCLGQRKSNLETEEPHAFHFPDNVAGDSMEVESYSKLDIVSSMKPEKVVGCSLSAPLCVTPNERKQLENPEESNIFTDMEMSLFWGVEEEVKESDIDVAVDKAITECSSSDFKEGDYVAITDIDDTNFSVKTDGPEDTEETTESMKNFSGQDAAIADKSPPLKNSEVGKVINSEQAPFETELNLLNVSGKKETSNSEPVKQLISSIMKSKRKPGLIQRTPKRPILFHDMKENEGGNTKRAHIGNMATPKTSSKLRRPLDRI